MLLLLKLLLWLLFLSPFAAALLFWLALSGEPLVPESASLSHADVARAKHIIEQHQQQQAGGEPLRLTLSERDLELAGTYLLRRLAESSLRIAIRDNQLHAKATLRIPGFPSRPYLNLQLDLRDQEGQPNLVHLQVNRFVVPRNLAHQLLAELLIRLYQTDEYRLARSIVDEIRLNDRQLDLSYRWSPDLERRARAAFLREPQAIRQAYRGELRRLLQQQPNARPSVTTLLQPLFAFARQRGGDPVEENRALLAMLGYWATTGRTIATELIGRDEGPPLRFRAHLNKRRDQARHFLISAAIAARIDDNTASLAGTYKEIEDAQRGSGFSFIDLAADRAGTRFGELAVASPRQARELQQVLAAGIREADIIPPIEALEEGVDLQKLEREYGGLESPQYQRIIDHIDARIDQCRIYRELKNPLPPYAVNS